MWCANNSESPEILVLLIFEVFGNAQVNEFEVSLFVDHETVWFHVPQNYLVRVQVFQNQDHVGSVELGVVSVQKTDFTDHRVKVLPDHVF